MLDDLELERLAKSRGFDSHSAWLAHNQQLQEKYSKSREAWTEANNIPAKRTSVKRSDKSDG